MKAEHVILLGKLSGSPRPKIAKWADAIRKLFEKGENMLTESSARKTLLPEAKENLIANAQLANRFGLVFLTHHPLTHFKREKYLPELLANLPSQYQRESAGAASHYAETHYFSPEEATRHRLYCHHGMLVKGPGMLPLSTEGAKQMVCMTLTGELYSHPKEAGFQHTSFNRGGYLLFAGFWIVEGGHVREIYADSGHYEPSAVALQNFVLILNALDLDLSLTKCYYADRHMVTDPTPEFYYTKTINEVAVSDLLNDVKIKSDILDSVVTPQRLELLNQMPRYASIIFASTQKNMTPPTTLEEVCSPPI
jgi:hypothetical protein